MATLKFSIEALEDPRAPRSVIEFVTIMRDFAQADPVESIAKTALRIVAAFPDDEFGMGYFCDTVISLAEQIPYHHPAQANLAQLLLMLTQSPKFLSKNSPKGCGDVYHPFQLLGEQIYDNMDVPDDDENPPMEWVNFHAFLAHLEASGAMTRDSPTYAVMELRDTFEEPAGDPNMQDYRVMASAQWILWYGQKLFRHMSHATPPPTDEARTMRVGSLSPAGTAPFSLQRWRLWQKGFEDAAGSKKRSEECRRVASKASDLMEVIATSRTF